MNAFSTLTFYSRGLATRRVQRVVCRGRFRKFVWCFDDFPDENESVQNEHYIKRTVHYERFENNLIPTKTSAGYPFFKGRYGHVIVNRFFFFTHKFYFDNSDSVKSRSSFSRLRSGCILDESKIKKKWKNFNGYLVLRKI